MKNSKIILSLIFVFIFIFSAFAFTACSKNCQGLTIPSNQSSGGGNTSGGSDSNGDDNEESIIDKLSNITITIETDPYYRGLGEKCRKNYYAITNDLKPIPYKFLREHGHNVDAYLEGTLNVFASSYIFDNDHNHIYVSVKAENVSYHEYGNYYTNYVLKYPLTNREYEDYITLSKSGCIQSLFFIQELDNQKTPEILSSVNIARKTYEKMIKNFPNTNINKNSNYFAMEIDTNYADMEKISISIREASVSNYYKTAIGFVDMSYKKLTWQDIYDNNVIYLERPTSVNYDFDEYQSSLQDITAFSYADRVYGTNPYSYDLFDKVNDKT